MNAGSLLERGVAELGRHLADPFVQARVRRSEVGRDGALWLDLDEGSIWFRVVLDPASGAIEAIEQYRPADDTALPLASTVDGRSEVLAWRPGRRLVVERHDGARHVVKGYRPKRFRAARVRHLAALELCDDGGFVVPPLLDSDTERACIHMGFVNGLDLSASTESTFDFAAVGAALARFQSGTTDLALEQHGALDELAVLDAIGERLLSLSGDLLPGWGAVRVRLGSLAPSVTSSFVPCHRDLHDRQLLVCESGPGLLDFDSLCAADAALDPANLLAHLVLRRLQRVPGCDATGVRACSEALIEGLGRDSDRAFFARLRFYQATALLRLAAVYGMRPRWAHLANDLVRLATRCVEDDRAPHAR